MKHDVSIPPGGDATEAARRSRIVKINLGAGRTEVERRHGKAWNSAELASDFEVIGFMAPYVVARRRTDGRIGSLEFQHCPRFYFNWQEDR